MPLLSEGDTIEYSCSLSHNYNNIKAGATTTIRPGESEDDAMDRLKAFTHAKALESLEELS